MTALEAVSKVDPIVFEEVGDPWIDESIIGDHSGESVSRGLEDSLATDPQDVSPFAELNRDSGLPEVSEDRSDLRSPGADLFRDLARGERSSRGVEDPEDGLRRQAMRGDHELCRHGSER